jgi:hypothetical protein
VEAEAARDSGGFAISRGIVLFGEHCELDADGHADSVLTWVLEGTAATLLRLFRGRRRTRST